MSLRIIYGRAGSGKTNYCLQEMKRKMGENSKIYMITPDQFSFSAEKNLLATISQNSTIQAEVLTFQRMAYRVLQEVGGATEVFLTESGTSMLLYDILCKEKSRLKFLGKSDQNVDVMNRLLTELKKHQVQSEQIKEAMEQIQDPYLKAKLEDVVCLYQTYEKRLDETVQNHKDRLTWAIENLSSSQMFNNSYIYIDEFAGFTTQEYAIILSLCQKAKQVNVALSLDVLEDPILPETDVFYPNKLTAMTLINMAKEQGISIDKPVHLQTPYRFKKAKSLAHLEQNLYEIEPKKYPSKPEELSLFLAMNPYAEMEYVARKIQKEVRENGYRFRDIAIITQNIEQYGTLTKAIFRQYEIPVFIDEKKNLQKNIIIHLVLSLLEIYAKNWSYEAVFQYIKSGLLSLPEEAIFQVEKYCMQWGIKGKKWYEDDWNFGNLSSEELKYYNEIRQTIVTPLRKLQKQLQGNHNAKAISQALYYFLQENFSQAMQEKIEHLDQVGALELAQEYETGSHLLLEVWDEMVTLFGEQTMGFERYKELLRMGIEHKDLGVIPPTQDQVTMGDVERTRSHQVKVCFIIGLNDGMFPNINKNEGFLDNEDRNNLKKVKIKLAKTTMEQLYDEQFNLYKAFTTAEEKLYLSYSSTNADGKAIRPSVLLTKIKAIFPELILTSDMVEKEYAIGSKLATFDALLENMQQWKEGKQVDPIWYEVYAYFAKHEPAKLKRALQALQDTNLPENLEENLVQQLYGNTLHTSISRLEQYRKCPYSFYLTYGLQLKEEQIYQIQPVDTGTFMHDVIDAFFESLQEEQISVKNLEKADIEKRIDAIVEEKLALAQYGKFTSNAKFCLLTRRLKKVLYKSIFYLVEQLQNSDFQILGNEIEFKKGGNYSPIEVALQDGKKVEITGKIDRADYAETDDGKWIRIIDYKSSAKDLQIGEIVYGLQLQLITYLDRMTQEQEFQSAGALYYHLADSMLALSTKMTPEQMEQKMRQSFQMKGFVLADVKVVKMMDKKLEKGSSDVIPVSLDKDGNISSRSTHAIAKDDFKNLQKQVIRTIRTIAKEILAGRIDLKPYCDKDRKTPCDYCSYHSICHFNTRNRGNRYTYLPNWTKEEILEKLRETEEKDKKVE